MTQQEKKLIAILRPLQIVCLPKMFCHFSTY